VARHDDLHPGNILLRKEDGEPGLYLIDLHAVRLSGPLSRSASFANLVVLDRCSASASAAPTGRPLPWRAYCRARPDLRLE